MDRELLRQCRMAMRGVPERLALQFAQGAIEMRAKPNGTAAGSNFEWNGYATVYGVKFPMWDPNGEPYKEDVGQWAARRSLANPNLDVPFLIGHNDAGIPLARTKSGTMKLAEDTTGLHSHVPSMDGRREEVRALASAVERGDLDEMSLAFVCREQRWDENFENRTIVEMDLHRGDVCAVTHGANPATAGAAMFPVEQLSFRRPAAIGGPHLLGRERRMPTAPYTVHASEDNACPQCQSMNDRDAYFCDQCGAAMPGGPVGEAVAEMGGDETQQCQSCLCMNATDAKYCDQCGAGLAGVTAYRGPGGVYALDYSDARSREQLAQLSTASTNDLPDSAFAYIEPGGTKDGDGRTTPRSLRHFPVQDAAHVRNALARAPQSPFGDKAMPKIKAAARKFGVEVSDAKAAGRPLEVRASATEDMDLAAAPDYNDVSTGAAGLTCPQCKTGNHGGAKFCNQCGHNFGAGATVMVDDSTGIPGEEVQMAAARKLEIMTRELELEELAAAR